MATEVTIVPSGNKSLHEVQRTSATDFTLVSEFRGYRHKEDKTNLPPGYLVEGSQNVLTNTASRLAIRGGFTLDGQVNKAITPVLGSDDFQMTNGQERHLRSANGGLQYRYVAVAGDKWGAHTFTQGQVYWIDLMTGLSSSRVNFAPVWNYLESKSILLFVNGDSFINEWSGGVTTMISATGNSITKSPTTTWDQEGFFFNGTRSVTINGHDYAYTGGEHSFTLTGVTPSPAAEPAQSVVQQTVRTTANSAATDLPTDFKNDLIGVLKNEVYIGSLTSNLVFISHFDNFLDFSFSSPRLPGEGGLLTLGGTLKAFVQQEDQMYMSAGKGFWYLTEFITSADNLNEIIAAVQLKVGPRQGTRSQALTFKSDNDVVFVSYEPVLGSLGRVDNIYLTPQITNISDPIKDDFDSYDFTDGSGIFFKNLYYVAIPKNNVVRIWNRAKGFWEAPQILPVSRFSIIDGELYGHSYQTPETFKLFTGYNDNGGPIDARAVFSYMNFGSRTKTKYFNEWYTEGYISGNTTLALGVQYEIDGCATQTYYDIDGSDSQIVCLRSAGNSLGKAPLGKNPLGGLNPLMSTSLPPKMRGIKTFPRTDFYEMQVSYASMGVDQRWELLAFGPRVVVTTFGNNPIKQ